MARPKRPATSSLSPSQAVFIVERAMAERKLSAADVSRYMSHLADEIREVEERIARLKDAAVAGVVRAVKRTQEVVGRRRARRAAKLGADRPARKISKAKSPARMLQGQYLGFMKQVPERERVKFKKMRERDGIEKTVSAMKMRLGK